MAAERKRDLEAKFGNLKVDMNNVLTIDALYLIGVRDEIINMIHKYVTLADKIGRIDNEVKRVIGKLEEKFCV